MHAKLYKNNYGTGTKKTLAELETGMGQLLDECCAKDIASSQGLGCDNMTAIIVEVNQNNIESNQS